MKDVVDEIDQLVDASLARPIVDDYSKNRYDKCPHCDREWHGIPITAWIAEMYNQATFDESYRVDTDDSEILCHGSDFIGPMKAPGVGNQWTAAGFAGIRYRINGHVYIRDYQSQARWWRTTLPSDAQFELRVDVNGTIIDPRETRMITIEIGDTSETFDAERVRFHYETDEVMIYQTTHPNTRVIADVLAESAPNIGGTWTPLTAPSVIGHPDDDPRVSVIAGGRRHTLSDLRDDDWVDIGAIRDGSTITMTPPDGESMLLEYLHIYCTDCGIELSGLDICQVVNDGVVTYVCREHYEARR